MLGVALNFRQIWKVSSLLIAPTITEELRLRVNSCVGDFEDIPYTNRNEDGSKAIENSPKIDGQVAVFSQAVRADPSVDSKVDAHRLRVIGSTHRDHQGTFVLMCLP